MISVYGMLDVCQKPKIEKILLALFLMAAERQFFTCFSISLEGVVSALIFGDTR